MGTLLSGNGTCFLTMGTLFYVYGNTAMGHCFWIWDIDSWLWALCFMGIGTLLSGYGHTSLRTARKLKSF